MRSTKKAFSAAAMVSAVALAGGVYATASGAGQRVVPSVVPNMSVFADERQPGTTEPQLAATFVSPHDTADMERTRVLAQALGRHHSRLVAFPSATGASVCYALLGRTTRDPAMSYCYQPLAADAPGPLAGQHFHAAALYSNIDGHAGVQLFGIAFDDVDSIRVQINGTYRMVPVRNNGFYLDLPNTAHEAVGLVEATLTDGTIQQHDIQAGG